MTRGPPEAVQGGVVKGGTCLLGEEFRKPSTYRAQRVEEQPTQASAERCKKMFCDEGSSIPEKKGKKGNLVPERESRLQPVWGKDDSGSIHPGIARRGGKKASRDKRALRRGKTSRCCLGMCEHGVGALGDAAYPPPPRPPPRRGKKSGFEAAGSLRTDSLGSRRGSGDRDGQKGGRLVLEVP